MPTPKNKYDRKHMSDMVRYQAMIDAIFNQAVLEAAHIGASIGKFDEGKPLSFNDYPLTKRRIDNLIQHLGEQIEVTIVDGVNSEWTLSNNKNNELCNRVFGDSLQYLTQAQMRRYYSNNDSARRAFIKRRENGLTLSDRVWRYTDEFKDEMEMGLDLGIRGGLSAQEMAKDLKQYLRYPDMLFRRVRDEHGNLHLSKRAADFHPGRGVYRSSYMNARRLAATETNIAYRTADHLRWQQLDFVVGIEIHLSNNHNCKGVPQGMFFDICDELKGKYPKDFKFTGWHPHCRCYATTILKTDDEIEADTQKILDGEPLNDESVNRVDDVPENFKDWLEKNEERIWKAKSLPYFIKDNPEYIEFESTRRNRMALQGTEIVGVSELTTKEFNHLSGDIREASKRTGIFGKDYGIEYSEFSDGTIMQWKDGKLTISTVRHQLSDGTVFCPAESLNSAFKKLRKGENLDFYEEYSIESLFHESVHATATRKTNILAGTMDEIIAETCTQLYARDRYVKILKAYNVDAFNFERIKTEGLGYNLECSKLRPFFTKNGNLQVGELINIANETESGTRIMMKKLTGMGIKEKNARKLLSQLLRFTV